MGAHRVGVAISREDVADLVGGNAKARAGADERVVAEGVEVAAEHLGLHGAQVLPRDAVLGAKVH
jgi:hypothetical protein